MKYLLCALIVLTPLFTVLSIWTGDGRWAATAAVCGIPIVLVGIAFTASERRKR